MEKQNATPSIETAILTTLKGFPIVEEKALIGSVRDQYGFSEIDCTSALNVLASSQKVVLHDDGSVSVITTNPDHLKNVTTTPLDKKSGSFVRNEVPDFSGRAA